MSLSSPCEAKARLSLKQLIVLIFGLKKYKSHFDPTKNRRRVSALRTDIVWAYCQCALNTLSVAVLRLKRFEPLWTNELDRTISPEEHIFANDKSLGLSFGLIMIEPQLVRRACLLSFTVGG